jgi:hypothetical protein
VNGPTPPLPTGVPSMATTGFTKGYAGIVVHAFYSGGSRSGFPEGAGHGRD